MRGWQPFGGTLLTLLVGWLVLAALDPLLPRLLNAYQRDNVELAGLNIILAVSLNLINGYTGQFSIGHAGFMSVGAYTAATGTLFLGWGLLPALLAGGATAALCGALVGLPTLRLKGDYLAIATLGFGEIIRIVLLNTQQIGNTGIDLRGAQGLSGIAPINTLSSHSAFFWIYFVALVTIVVILNLVHSSPGRAFKAVREDELAAEVMGINTTYYKVAAFTIGAFFAGLAGGLYAHKYLILTPQTFNFIYSIMIVVMVVLGGMGSTTGCVLAAILLTFLPEWLRDVSHAIGAQVGRPDLDLRLTIYSALLIVLMLVRPQGLMGASELSWRKRPRSVTS